MHAQHAHPSPKSLPKFPSNRYMQGVSANNIPIIFWPNCLFNLVKIFFVCPRIALRHPTLTRFKFELENFIEFCEDNSIIKTGEWTDVKIRAEAFRRHVTDYMNRVTPPELCLRCTIQIRHYLLSSRYLCTH